MNTDFTKNTWVERMPVWVRFVALAVAIGFVLRIALLAITPYHLPLTSYWIFAVGALNDAMVMVVLLIPMWLWYLSIGSKRFAKPWGWICLGAIALTWVLLKFCAGPLVEFNKGLHRVLCWVVVYWGVSFALRMFIPKMRRGWNRAWTVAIITIYLTLMIFNMIGEWFFWDEFNVRYNFIAVDYLVYTNEVIGNICESYPIPWIVTAIVIFALGLEWLLFRDQWKEPSTADFKSRNLIWYVMALAVSIIGIPSLAKLQNSDNVYRNELQASGIYSFCVAFTINEIDYDSFYYIGPDIDGTEPAGIVAADSIEQHPNIVLITMESMSADYMARYGGKKQLTPALDTLANHSLNFSQMFAAGNRTVRGLEALTLSRPPSPGESIIKRAENKGYPSIGDILRDKGYRRVFLYGGDSYFDNMESFYNGLDFEIVDNGNFSRDEVTFKTIWGICDGDVYDKLLLIADSCDTAGRPFFVQMMTTSNHRPYTYPDGLISIPPSKKKRDGGVMYADFALGDFMAKAREKDWFDHTMFVIVADHCASSAGKTELPLDKYHIPAMIYAPWMLEAAEVDKVASQIDVMPTLFALLGWQYDTPLYGRDILSDDFEQRAFLATYQDLGYFENDTLTVLSPVRRVRQYAVSPTDDNPLATQPAATLSAPATDKAASYYRRSANHK